jgi:hypothetical protein
MNPLFANSLLTTAASPQKFADVARRASATPDCLKQQVERLA